MFKRKDVGIITKSGRRRVSVFYYVSFLYRNPPPRRCVSVILKQVVQIKKKRHKCLSCFFSTITFPSLLSDSRVAVTSLSTSLLSPSPLPKISHPSVLKSSYIRKLSRKQKTHRKNHSALRDPRGNSGREISCAACPLLGSLSRRQRRR